MQQRRQQRPLTPRWSPPASCWSEQEDRALAQSLADSQREEIYRQQRKPNYFPAHRQQQRKKGRTFWSRHGDHFTCSSAHSQQQPPMRSWLDSTHTRHFQPMQHYVEPTYQQPRPKQAESKDSKNQRYRALSYCNSCSIVQFIIGFTICLYRSNALRSNPHASTPNNLFLHYA